MDLKRPGSWLRQILNVSGVIIVILGLVAVATYNASSQKRELPNFNLPKSLLFQYRDDEGNAVLSAVVTEQGKKWWVIPRATVLNAELPEETMQASAKTLTVVGARNALADSVQLNIDDVWQIDRLGLAALIENIGGIDVTPKRDMVLGKLTSDDFMSLRAGNRVHLDGIYGAWYAITADKESDQLAQFEDVWHQLMNRTDAATLGTVLSSVGSVSRASLAHDELVIVFEKWQQVADVDGMTWPIIDVAKSDGLSVISPAGVAQLVQSGVRERLAS